MTEKRRGTRVWRRERWAAWVMMALVVGIVGCVVPDGCTTNDCLELGECYGTLDEGFLYPLQDGAWWQHDNVDSQTENVSCKVVSVGPERDVPLLEGVRAHENYSVRADAWGIRWQETLTDGSVVRRLDEWFELPPEDQIDQIPNVITERSRIKYYCPSRNRVSDGDRACECGNWTHERWEASITLADIDPADWSTCEAIQVNIETCEPVGNIPAGCEFVRDHSLDRFEINVLHGAGDENIDVRAGSFDEVLEVYRWGEEYDVEDPDGTLEKEQDIFYWVRGVGKIMDDSSPDDLDYLVDWCLPSDQDDQDEPDCSATRPTFTSTYGEACPDPR